MILHNEIKNTRNINYIGRFFSYLNLLKNKLFANIEQQYYINVTQKMMTIALGEMI